MSWLLGLTFLVASAGGKLTLQVVLGTLAGQAGMRAGAMLDGFKGEVAWHSVVNFIVLRMISWSCDFARSLGESLSTNCSTSMEERARADTHRNSKEYRSLVLYLSYLFYPPLYLTGPIITFNAFASYMMEPQQTYKSKDLCVYALRWLANTAILILFGHFLYTFAIMENGSKVPFAGDTATYFDSLFSFRQDGEGMVWFSYWALKGLWLKFLVVWRFARLCALVDGVCPPENMNRCMSNNYTVKGFWRAWHRSFNRWLVRYIYVPIGGSRQKSVLRRVVSVLTVFMFVALWHEPKVFWKDWDMVRVMVWGLLMAAFMVPELLVERVCSLPSVQQSSRKGHCWHGT